MNIALICSSPPAQRQAMRDFIPVTSTPLQFLHLPGSGDVALDVETPQPAPVTLLAQIPFFGAMADKATA